MQRFDLIVKGGRVATAADVFEADIGIRDGKVAALAQGLEGADEVIDATGRIITPGGVEAHCHIEQETSSGIMGADDYRSGSISAAFGGNTTFVPFAAQYKGQSLREVVKTYHDRAGPKSVIDYTFHLIVSDPTEQVLGQELPALIAAGYTSFKVYMTYATLKIDDGQFLDVLATARKHGAMTMVHAENNEMIGWMTRRLIDAGNTEPKYYPMSHPSLAEAEASNRAIQLARLVDTPLLIVHVSDGEAADAILNARNKGLKIYGETCPQYLFLTAEDVDLEGMEGAKFCCSPPPRDKAGQEAIWRGLTNGTFQVFSSDHAPSRFDETGKLHAGPNPPFNKLTNGVPGIELRMPLLFSEGVNKGRISLQQFVQLTAYNACEIYGLAPRKGTIAIGSDADLVIWDQTREVTVTYDLLHDNVGYTPYEGMQLTGWPETVVNRGRVIVDGGELKVEPGSGAFLERQPGHPASKPAGQLRRELDPSRNFGADIL